MHRAAREALRQSLQPDTYKEFLQRSEDVHGAAPGSLTLDDTAAEGAGEREKARRERECVYQQQLQRDLNSRSIGVMTTAALAGDGARLGGGSGVGGERGDKVIRATPSRQEMRKSPPPPPSPPALSKIAGGVTLSLSTSRSPPRSPLKGEREHAAGLARKYVDRQNLLCCVVCHF